MHPYMNRHDRRRAQRTDGRRSARRAGQRPRMIPMLIGSQLLLQPVEHIVDQIERHGRVPANTDGQPQFQAADGHWEEAAPAIQELIWHFEMWCIRHRCDLPLQPLRDLHTALHFLVPVHDTTLEALRLTLPVLRRVLAFGERADQGDLMQQALIKGAMEDRT